MMERRNALTEQELDHLVELDMATQGDAAGAGSPAVVSAVTAVTALVTSSGLCPTWACTKDCRR